jgi:transcription elongation factor Elf1
MISVRILRNPKEKSKIVCGSCGLRWEEAAISNRESIDVYNQFIDEFTMKRG